MYVIHYTNRLKKENHKVIAINAEKVFDKIQHPSVTTSLPKIGRGEILHLDQEHLQNFISSANIIPNRERLNAFLL